MKRWIDIDSKEVNSKGKKQEWRKGEIGQSARSPLSDGSEFESGPV